MRTLISTDYCACCGQECKWYLEVLENDRVKRQYEGCKAGWVRGRLNWHHSIDEVSADIAFGILFRRHDQLRQERDAMEKTLKEIDSTMTLLARRPKKYVEDVQM